jgi:hypothetical protein
MATHLRKSKKKKAFPLECDGHYRICGAMATRLRESKKEKAWPDIHYRPPAPPQTEPTISPKPKELAITSRGDGLNVKPVGRVYRTGRSKSEPVFSS